MTPRLQDWLYIHHGIRLGLPGYLDLLVLSLALGAWFLLRHCRSRGLDQRPAYVFLLLAIPLLFAGGKLLYAAQFPHVLQKGWDFWSGNGSSLYGGLLGVLIAGLLAFWWYQTSPWPYLDGCAVSLALGLALTRIGCFLAGCNWGSVTDLPWGVRFPPDSHAFRQHVQLGLISEEARLSLPVHPTQLYEALASLALFLLGLRMLKRSRVQGNTFLLLLGVYSCFRLLEEFVRADYGVRFYGLSFAQWISLGLMASLFALIKYRTPSGATIKGPSGTVRS